MTAREQTRRDFLLGMARGAAFMVPTMTTLSLTQKGKGGGGKPPGPPGPPPGVSPPIGGNIQMMRADPDRPPWKATGGSGPEPPWGRGSGTGDGGDGAWPPTGGGDRKPPRK